MVNVGFPERFGYGFEMVEEPGEPRKRHQSKIYAKSNQSDFS
jgi:hypothetical protein